MFMMITTNFVKRLHEEAIEQRLHQAKGLIGIDYWIHGYDTNSKSSLLFDVNDKTRKIDVSLAHRQKLCFENKDQVA